MGNDRHESTGARSKRKEKSVFTMTWVTMTAEDIAAQNSTQTLSLDESLERMFECAESGWKFSLSYSESYSGYENQGRYI